jgi:F-box and leucine-rich repeat protein 7
MSPYAGRTATPLSAEVVLVRNFDSQANPSRPVRQSPLATSQIQGMPLDLIDRIRSFPLFRSTSDSFLAEIGLLLKPQMNSTNDYIITEGDDAKAMYWVVRGAVAVTSRDGESTYAELKSGSFFGEIGILMDRPRTATVVARSRCLLLVLKKEDLRKVLPKYPDVEQAIREEALERLTILEKKKKQAENGRQQPNVVTRRGSKRARDAAGDEMDISGNDLGVNGSSKRRKSPSPGMNEVAASSALGHGLVNVRALLKELPLFSSLPPDMLHFLGLSAQPQSFPPFTDIIKQDTQGREVYFIVRGEVEVLDEKQHPAPTLRSSNTTNGISKSTEYVKARLKSGQYFGEVVSLSLADRRTATVRSVSAVECLMISGDVLREFWERCPGEIRQQIEDTAKQRLQSASDNDVVMSDTESTPDINDLFINETIMTNSKTRQPPVPARVTFNDKEISGRPRPVTADDQPAFEPSDPDPFSSVGLDKVRSRSRRGSLAPLSPDEAPDKQKKHSSPRSSPKSSPKSSRSGTPSPVRESKANSFFSDPFSHTKRPKPKPRVVPGKNQGTIPEKLLILTFQYLELHELMSLQAVSLHWQNILTKSPDLFHRLDLSRYNRKITDEVLTNRICPFVGARPRIIDISNCFHVTDEGFASLTNLCGANVRAWRMKSVWDVTAPAILEMSNKARGLQDVDLSNCRKVSDTLLARIIGWVVPQTPIHHRSNGRPNLNARISSSQAASQPPPGTVFGCPELKRLTLSYCKHITDRSMHHIASHAAARIEYVDLTRCTTITDTGFQYWGNANFSRLRKLCLADCTYLTDSAIIYLTNAAKGLQELDLVSRMLLSYNVISIINTKFRANETP